MTRSPCRSTPSRPPTPFAPLGAAIGPAVESDDFFAVFWRWEKYRLIYNAVLLAETLLGMVAWSSLRRPSFWPYLMFCGLFANLCFCLGPVLNGHAWRFGH